MGSAKEETQCLLNYSQAVTSSSARFRLPLAFCSSTERPPRKMKNTRLPARMTPRLLQASFASHLAAKTVSVPRLSTQYVTACDFSHKISQIIFACFFPRFIQEYFKYVRRVLNDATKEDLNFLPAGKLLYRKVYYLLNKQKIAVS